MAFPGPRIAVALSVAVSVATGLVTNLLTGRWNPTLAAALVVLATAGILLAVRAASSRGGTRRTRGRMTANGGSIRYSGQTLSGGARVTANASGGGRIDNSPIIADGADYTMKAGGNGEIIDSPVGTST